MMSGSHTQESSNVAAEHVDPNAAGDHVPSLPEGERDGEQEEKLCSTFADVSRAYHEHLAFLGAPAGVVQAMPPYQPVLQLMSAVGELSTLCLGCPGGDQPALSKFERAELADVVGSLAVALAVVGEALQIDPAEAALLRLQRLRRKHAKYHPDATPRATPPMAAQQPQGFVPQQQSQQQQDTRPPAGAGAQQQAPAAGKDGFRRESGQELGRAFFQPSAAALPAPARGAPLQQRGAPPPQAAATSSRDSIGTVSAASTTLPAYISTRSPANVLRPAPRASPELPPPPVPTFSSNSTGGALAYQPGGGSAWQTGPPQQQQQQQYNVSGWAPHPAPVAVPLSPTTLVSFFPMLEAIERCDMSMAEFEDLGLTFCIPYNGELVELVPNGCLTRVTKELFPRFLELARPYRPPTFADALSNGSSSSANGSSFAPTKSASTPVRGAMSGSMILPPAVGSGGGGGSSSGPVPAQLNRTPGENSMSLANIVPPQAARMLPTTRATDPRVAEYQTQQMNIALAAVNSGQYQLPAHFRNANSGSGAGGGSDAPDARAPTAVPARARLDSPQQQPQQQTSSRPAQMLLPTHHPFNVPHHHGKMKHRTVDVISTVPGYDPQAVGALFSPSHFTKDLFSPHSTEMRFDVAYAQSPSTRSPMAAETGRSMMVMMPQQDANPNLVSSVPDPRSNANSASPARAGDGAPKVPTIPDAYTTEREREYWDKIRGLVEHSVKGPAIAALGLTFSVPMGNGVVPLVNNGKSIPVTVANVAEFLGVLADRQAEFEGRLCRSSSMRTIAVANLASYDPQAVASQFSPSHFANSANLFAPFSTASTFPVDYDNDAAQRFLPQSLKGSEIKQLPTAQHFVEAIAGRADTFASFFEDIAKDPDYLSVYQVTWCVPAEGGGVCDLLPGGHAVLVRHEDHAEYVDRVLQIYPQLKPNSNDD